MQWATHTVYLTLTCLWHNLKNNIYTQKSKISLLYLRYTDDIFIIWKGTKEELITFINGLNKIHRTIKFEYEISSQKIPFLGKVVFKDKE